MTWRKITNFGKIAGIPFHDVQVMSPDEDEEGWSIVPKEFPEEKPNVPVEPAKEPVKEPEKVPAHTGRNLDDDDRKPKGKFTPEGKMIGYKFFEIGKDEDKNWRLYSPSQKSMMPEPWPKGALTAICGNGRDHPVPAPRDECNCGFHMCHSEDSQTLSSYEPSNWLGRLEAWGDNNGVRSGSLSPDVIRARHVQIVGIKPPKCERCSEPSTHLIAANPDAKGGIPVCMDHKPDTISGGSMKVHAVPVEDVAKGLSEYYGGLEIKNHGEKWGDDDFDNWEDQFKSSARVAGSPFVREFKKVREHAELHGWKAQPTKKGWIFLPPMDEILPGAPNAKGIVTTHATPSDHRAFKNFLGELHATTGLRPPGRCEICNPKRHDPVDCLKNKDLWDPSFDRDTVAEFHQMAHEWEPERRSA